MSPLSGFKILVVEDDEHLREFLSEDLRSAGAIVTAADSGKNAFKLIQLETFDAVLSDLRMPHGDGRYLAKEVSTLPQASKPIFFLYTGASDISASEAQELQIAEIFPKPFDPLNLHNSLSNHISQKKNGPTTTVS